ncbi:MAG: hypothetical protein AB8B52_04380 [Winogradskyella sp.]|uniref:hypothetical protein n=1 Tax=Winogradskyella sp. TaxID=1883156 RepID=UPI00385C08D3
MTLETLNFWKPRRFAYSIFILSFLMLGCKSQKTTFELQSVFNQEELKDLETMRTFFIEDILDLNDENFYKEFRQRIVKLEAEGFKSVVPKKIDRLLNSISKSTFNEIWEIKTQKRSRTGNETYTYFAPRLNSKYQEFLSQTTKHNSMVMKYYNNMIQTEAFSHGSMLDYISDNNLDFDLKNTNVQIVMAIHYISICYDNNNINQFIN